MQSLGNNFWYVVFVVPLQTATSFFLALVVSNRFLKGRASSVPPSTSPP